MQASATTLAASYDSQLAEKVEATKQQFSPFSAPELEVFASKPLNFRMRAEFKMWFNKETELVEYAMHKPGEPNNHFAITDFPIASEKINSLMPLLLELINQSDTLKRKLFQAEFLTSTTGHALISLIYHKPLNESWEAKAKEIAETLKCSVIGRSRKQKITIGEDCVYEQLQVDGQKYTYHQVENSFTQPNADICEKMLNWAVGTVKNLGGDLLELYCGNGNFTLPLSQQFEHVLATEISKASVKSAVHNMQENGCSNIAIARMSSEEFTQALNKERAFRRLKDIDLDSYQFSTIFVDPPRAGLDPDTEALAARFDNILYISCNPNTLCKNLETFTQTHKITKLALFDQFPYTEHRECGVLLQKK